MEIITFESKAYKELDNKITAIADYIFVHRILVKTEERAGSESKISVFLVGCAQYLERKCRSPPYADAGSLKRAE